MGIGAGVSVAAGQYRLEFLMWHNPAHMTAGHAAAAASRRTPKHLRAHLKGLSMNSSTNAGRHSAGASIGGVGLKARGGQSEPMGNKVKTGAAKQMTPSNTSAPDGSTQQAQQQIRQSPTPFRNPRGPAMAATGVGPNKGIGNGATANSASVSGSRPPKHPPTGPTGGYKPKKNFGPVGKPSFYGSR